MKTTIGVVALVVVVAGGIIAYRLASGPAERSPRECAEVADIDERARCMEPYFARVVADGTVAETLQRLEDLFVEGVLDDCHHLAHHLGHAALAEIGDLADTMRAGSDDCIDGYFHGAVEAAVGGGGAHEGHEGGGLADLDAVCAPLEGEDEYHPCIHGLGHGAMQATGHDVAASLAACRTLSEDNADTCVGGVMMENTMQFMDLDPEEFTSAAARGCDAGIEEDLVALCYDQIGEVSMFYFGHDLDTALQVCAAIGDPVGTEECTEGAEAEGELVERERAEH